MLADDEPGHRQWGTETMRKFKTGGMLGFVAVFAVIAYAALVGVTGSLNLDTATHAQEAGNVPGRTLGNVSDSDVWRQIRRGEVGKVSIPDLKSAVLINAEGSAWRAARNGPVSFWGGLAIAASLGFIFLFNLIHGRILIKGGRSGQVIPRFSQAERWVHWFAAGSFILLGLTGLALIFGRYALKPVFGPEVFAIIANASLQSHNLFGPIFIVALVIMIVLYMRDNLWQKGDFSWALQGGFLSDSHPKSWKYNLGEKAWYWAIFFGGLALSGTGLLLEFPWLVDQLSLLQLAHITHAIAALVLIAISFGHIYLGVWGVEGGLDGMTKGYVDVNWAKEHHGWWADEVMENGTAVVEGASEAEGEDGPTAPAE